MKDEVLKAIKCCRGGLCEDCPLQPDICDEFYIDTETIPTQLLDLIEETLENEE